MNGSDTSSRYSRHLSLPDFGAEEQERLRQAKVLIVGCGGLGAPVMLYLAAAGVGTIGLVDDDVVTLSNLQRQVIFTEEDLGKSKASAAARHLRKLNSEITIKEYHLRLTSENALEKVEVYDIIIDGTDNLPARYLLNDAAVLGDKILVHGSIYRYEGQVSVFNMPGESGRSANYRDLFPEPPPPELITSCAEGGVLGVLPGMVGSIMASETIKVITGVGEVMADKLLLLDAATMDFRKIKIRKNPENPVSGEHPAITQLIDYELFCNPDVIDDRDISAQAFLQMPEESYQLIDVREQHEYAADNIGGVNIPLSQLPFTTMGIAPNKKTILMCQSGKRSRKAVEMLTDLGVEELYNLKGGLDAVRLWDIETLGL